MTLHHSLRDLVAARGTDVVSDAAEFRAALDDFLAEDEISTGDLNVLVDAVRLGAVERLVDLLDHGSDPAAAVGVAGTTLARDRGSDDPARSLRAVAVLGFAIGRVDEQVVRAFVSTAPPAGATAGRPQHPAPAAAAPAPTVVSGGVVPPPVPAQTRPSRRSWRLPVLVVAVVLLIVAAGAVGWVFLRGETPEDAVDDLFDAESCEEEIDHVTGEQAAVIQNLLDSNDPFCVNYGEYDSEPETVRVVEDGDQATAVVKGTTQYTGDDESVPDEQPFSAVLELRRADGDWRVSHVDFEFTDE
jgi:hypothetical protein